MVSTLRQASSPPLAATLRSMTSAAVVAGLPSPAGFFGGAGVAPRAKEPQHRAPQRRVDTSLRMPGLKVSSDPTSRVPQAAASGTENRPSARSPLRAKSSPYRFASRPPPRSPAPVG